MFPSPWTIGNDTPSWMRPRRMVWHIYRWRDGPGVTQEQLTDKAGRRRFFKTYEQAQRALAKVEAADVP